MKSIKSLKNKAGILAREVAFLKYGKFCYVKKFYPHLKLRHTEIIQADHCISCANKYFVYDIRNLLPICSGCNSAKSNHLKSVERAVNDMVRKRNPKWYKDAVWLDQSLEANPNFSKRWWLNEVIFDLEKELCKLKKPSC